MFDNIHKDVDILNKIKIKNKEIKESKQKKQELFNISMILISLISSIITLIYFNFSLKGTIIAIIIAIIASIIVFMAKVILYLNLNKKYSNYQNKYNKNIPLFKTKDFISEEDFKKYLEYEKELSENGLYILKNKNIYKSHEETVYNLVKKEIIEADSEDLLAELDSTVNMIKVLLNNVESHSHTIKMLFDKIFGEVEEQVIYGNIEGITNIIEENFNKMTVNKYKKDLQEIKQKFEKDTIDETFEGIKEKTEEELLEEKFEKLKNAKQENEYTW